MGLFDDDELEENDDELEFLELNERNVNILFSRCIARRKQHKSRI